MAKEYVVVSFGHIVVGVVAREEARLKLFEILDAFAETYGYDRENITGEFVKEFANPLTVLT